MLEGGSLVVRMVGVEPHLDPRFSWLQSGRVGERRRDFFRVFSEAVDYAADRGVDAFLLPGDVFDRVNPRNSAMAAFASALSRLRDAGVRVFAVPGHHDLPRSAGEPSPLVVFHEAGLLTLFHRLDRIEGVTFRAADGERVWVGGVGFNPYLGPGEDPLASLLAREPDADVAVLMTHNTIKGFSAYSPDDPVVDPASLPGWIDLVVAGHLHEHAVRKIGNLTVCYVGTAERLSFAEEGQRKGFAVIEVDGGEVRVSQVETEARPMRTVRVTVPEQGDLTELIVERLREASRTTPGEALVRVRLEGAMRVEVLSTYRRLEVIREGSRMFFGIYLDEGEVEYVGTFEAPHVELETPLRELEGIYRGMLRSTEVEEDRELLEEAYRRARDALEEAGGW